MTVSVFLYGSLMIPSSLSKALGREVSSDEMEPATLQGYRRTWQARVPVYSTSLDRDVAGVFLDLKVAPGRYVNGLVVEVDGADLVQLRIREAQYVETDISDCLVVRDESGARASGRVRAITFVAPAKFKKNIKGLDSLVPQSYEARVLDICATRGDAFMQDFKDTTEKPRFKMFEGSYRFLDEDQQKRV